MAMKRPAFNPNSFLMDDGQDIDGSALTGLGAMNAGAEQIRQRREMMSADDHQYPQSGFGPGRSMGGLSLPSEDAMFGLMQMKENAAGSAGKNFDLAPNSYQGPTPTTNFQAGQTFLPDSLAGIQAATAQRKRKR